MQLLSILPNSQKDLLVEGSWENQFFKVNHLFRYKGKYQLLWKERKLDNCG